MQAMIELTDATAKNTSIGILRFLREGISRIVHILKYVSLYTLDLKPHAAAGWNNCVLELGTMWVAIAVRLQKFLKTRRRFRACANASSI